MRCNTLKISTRYLLQNVRIAQAYLYLGVSRAAVLRSFYVPSIVFGVLVACRCLTRDRTASVASNAIVILAPDHLRT